MNVFDATQLAGEEVNQTAHQLIPGLQHEAQRVFVRETPMHRRVEMQLQQACEVAMSVV